MRAPFSGSRRSQRGTCTDRSFCPRLPSQAGGRGVRRGREPAAGLVRLGPSRRGEPRLRAARRLRALLPGGEEVPPARPPRRPGLRPREGGWWPTELVVLIKALKPLFSGAGTSESDRVSSGTGSVDKRGAWDRKVYGPGQPRACRSWRAVGALRSQQAVPGTSLKSSARVLCPRRARGAGGAVSLPERRGAGVRSRAPGTAFWGPSQ